MYFIDLGNTVITQHSLWTHEEVRVNISNVTIDNLISMKHIILNARKFTVNVFLLLRKLSVQIEIRTNKVPVYNIE
jgi:hypothetical protein